MIYFNKVFIFSKIIHIIQFYQLSKSFKQLTHDVFVIIDSYNIPDVYFLPDLKLFKLPNQLLNVIKQLFFVI